MKRLLATMTAALLVLTFAGSALAANPATGKSSITAFGDGATQVSKTAVRIDTTTGNGGGAYIPGFNNSFYGVRTALVKDLSNSVTGSTLGIDPHWSIPIDIADTSQVHDGFTDYFVYASFANCNNGLGLVDVINDTTCTIDMGDGSNTSYPNWKAFVTANPNTYIALNDNYAFVIADLSGAPGVWTISNMKVGKPGK